METLEEVLEKIGESAFDLAKKSTGEEKAFYLGMINIVSAITEPETPGIIRICMNYEKVKNEYESAMNQTKEHQITFEELFPELFDYIDKKLAENKKKTKKTEE